MTVPDSGSVPPAHVSPPAPAPTVTVSRISPALVRKLEIGAAAAFAAILLLLIAVRSARRVWLATDCDREGQLIGQEILEHYNYRGQVMRVLFTAQDTQTIREGVSSALVV